MRNRDPRKENVESILTICLSILTIQHARVSPSASHAMSKSPWNAQNMNFISTCFAFQLHAEVDIVLFQQGVPFLKYLLGQ